MFGPLLNIFLDFVLVGGASNAVGGRGGEGGGGMTGHKFVHNFNNFAK